MNLNASFLIFFLMVVDGGCSVSTAEQAQHDVSALGPSEADHWLELMEQGESFLAEGRYHEALEVFLEADSLTIFEVPNYEALHRVAEVRCLLGDREEGLKLLEDFRCMLAVDRGEIPCYLGRETLADLGTPNPVLTELCLLRMCSEMYLSYYENPSEEYLAAVAERAREADRIQKVCETAESGGS